MDSSVLSSPYRTLNIPYSSAFLTMLMRFMDTMQLALLDFLVQLMIFFIFDGESRRKLTTITITFTSRITSIITFLAPCPSILAKSTNTREGDKRVSWRRFHPHNHGKLNISLQRKHFQSAFFGP